MVIRYYFTIWKIWAVLTVLTLTHATTSQQLTHIVINLTKNHFNLSHLCLIHLLTESQYCYYVKINKELPVARVWFILKDKFAWNLVFRGVITDHLILKCCLMGHLLTKDFLNKPEWGSLGQLSLPEPRKTISWWPQGSQWVVPRG